MGYYTKLNLSVQLNKDAPFEILDKLVSHDMWKEITGEDQPNCHLVANTPNLPIDHPFGRTHRWNQIFHKSTTKLNLQRKTLKIQCEIKAYEDDYELLLDWLKPFIVSGSVKTKGEEDRGWTTLFTK